MYTGFGFIYRKFISGVLFFFKLNYTFENRKMKYLQRNT